MSLPPDPCPEGAFRCRDPLEIVEPNAPSASEYRIALIAIANADGSWDVQQYAQDVLDGTYREDGPKDRYSAPACHGLCGEARVTPGRHPNSQRFHDLLLEAGELHDRKQADYGAGTDPFANVRASTEWGIPAWVGAMVRLNDKVRRLQSLAQKGHLVNEAAVDSFMDIAVYALIARVLFEQEEEQ